MTDESLEFWRNLSPVLRSFIVSIGASVLVLVFLARDELPRSGGAWYAYIYDFDKAGCFHCEDKNLILLGGRLPDPKATVKQRTDAVIAALHAKSDMELRAVTAAQRPCASQLLDCQGLAETFVKNAALAEATQRAKDAESQLKERDQQIAQSSAQAALESASAAVRNAEAAERNAAVAERNIWFTAIGGAIAGGTLVFTGLTYRENRRKNRQSPSTTTP
jgi:hypothetical protein